MHASARRARLALAALALALPRAAQEPPPLRLEGLSGTGVPSAFGGLEDVSDQGVAFVEIVLERDTVLEREPFTVRLRFGLEVGFLRENVVQLFQRELDVPVQLHAPWLALEGETGLAGATALERADPESGASVALGETVVLAAPLGELERGGKTYRAFELERAFVAEDAGELRLEAPAMRFARATRFEDDFVQGRRPLDRGDARVAGRGASVAVVPLPEEGRPPEFTGALGRFALRAEAAPRELAAGEGLALTVVIEAQGALGDLSRAEPPRLDALEGFHVRGSLLVERSARRLEARYDLVPRGPEVRAVPPVRFASFDTTPPAGYRVLESEPIAITVRAPAAPPREPAPRPAPETLASWTWLVWFALGALALLLVARRRRARPR